MPGHVQVLNKYRVLLILGLDAVNPAGMAVSLTELAGLYGRPPTGINTASTPPANNPRVSDNLARALSPRFAHLSCPASVTDSSFFSLPQSRDSTRF